MNLSQRGRTVEHMFDQEHEGIPQGLAEMQPGPVLAAFLSTIDRNRISGRDKVTVLKARERLRSWVEAQFYADIEAVAEAELEIFEDPALAQQATADEVRAALTMTRRGADGHINIANDLARLPEVWRTMESGDLSLSKARVIAENTRHLPQATARQVAHEALDLAPRQTTGQLRARLSKLVLEVDPDAARSRYQAGVEDRRVMLNPTEVGTANLGGSDLPSPRAAAAMKRLNRLARRLRRAGDDRTMDQLRADIFLDLLNGNTVEDGVGGGEVHISVELTTLAGLDEHPGDLNGFHPVIADIARQVVRDRSKARHRVTVTEDGEPIWAGSTRRRATVAQRDQVISINRVCVFPGCRVPATDCDLDHTIEYSKGGPTEVWNNAPLCRHDHVGRHKRGWRIERVGRGCYLWTSPLGHRYLVGPEAARPPP